MSKSGFETIDDLAEGLKSGKIKPSNIDPIRVVEKDGKLYSLDNRRLFAYKEASIKDIPVEHVSLDDPDILKEWGEKFRAINIYRSSNY